MCKNKDAATVIRALDTALLEQARQWRSFISRCEAAGNTRGVDWAEEFCLVVRNRLAKLQRQQVLAQVCQASPRRLRGPFVSAVHRGLRRTAGKVVSRRTQDVQST